MYTTLSNYYLIGWWCDVDFRFFACWFDSRFCYCCLTWETGGLELASTIILIIQANQLTKCASLPNVHDKFKVYEEAKEIAFSRITSVECCNYTSMTWIQIVYYVKNKSILYICQRNVCKMYEQIFVTKSFKLLFLHRFYFIEYNYTFKLLSLHMDFISLNLIIRLLHPKRGRINLQPWIKENAWKPWS